MSLHDFESRAGLDTMLLHFSHDSSHSLSSSAALEGLIVVPKSDRPPLAAKSHNIQSRTTAKRASKSVKLGSRVSQDISFAVSASRPNSPREYDADAESEPPFSLLLPSRPCTPFQPLPPVLATSPLRLSSFLDDIVSHSLHNDSNAPSPAPSLRSESPPPRPLLAINIPSVSHPNSPYVPWASSVRQNILRPLTPSSPVSVYSRPYSRSGARAPEPQELDPPPPRRKLLRLSKSLKNLKRTVQQSVKHVKNAFKKTPKTRTEAAAVDYLPPPSPPCLSPIPPPLPSPVASCDSSNTNTLVDWLRECELKLERAPPRFMTLEEYEARGSWMDLTTCPDESEIRSVPMPHSMDDISEPVDLSRPTSPTSDLVSPVHTPILPACSPMSPTLPGSLFPHLSMYDIWPTPPRYVPTTRGLLDTRNREMSMPGGWKATLRCSPRATS